MEYYFSIVKDVLPISSTRGSVLPKRRPYVPKGSRPHICLAARDGGQPQLGGLPVRLRGDGTSARASSTTAETTTSRAESQADNGAREERHTVGLGSLLTVDAKDGRRCVRYSASLGGAESHVSSPVPSGRRIVALLPTQRTATTTEALSRLYASDDKGNLYHFQSQKDPRSTQNATAASSTKQARAEADRTSAAVSGNDASDGEAWQLLLPARSALPSAIVNAAEAAATVSLFSHSLGAPGWAGLVSLDENTLVCAREHYQDLRIVDVTRQEVVRAYATTHPATALICPGRESWSEVTPTGSSAPTALSEHVVLVAEGCLATLFDVRCPSAVMTISAARVKHASAETATEEKTVPADTSEGPLVPGRLTSVNGQVRDVCSTVHPYEVALAVDRALSVYDYRKFTRAFSASNVLKYTISSIAPFAGGRAVVCSGIDAEVRIIALHAKETLFTAPTERLSMTSNQAAASRPSAKNKNKEDAGAPAPDDPTGSTFRTRLNSSVSCTSTWQGGWVSSLDGRIAVGVSMDNELFLVQ